MVFFILVSVLLYENTIEFIITEWMLPGLVYCFLPRRLFLSSNTDQSDINTIGVLLGLDLYCSRVLYPGQSDQQNSQCQGHLRSMFLHADYRVGEIQNPAGSADLHQR
jgi:hypothetical protein